MNLWREISKKISFHCVYDESILEALLYARDKGFAGIQIAIETPHLSFENVSDKECSQIKTFCKKHNLYLTIHGPDVVTSLFTINPQLKRGIISYYKELFTFSEKVNSKLITIHLGRITEFPTDTIPEIKFPEKDLTLLKNSLKSNLDSLLKLADNRFLICIENYRLDSLILDVLQPYLERNEIYLCWDLSKTFNAQLERIEQIEQFFLKYVKSIKQIHLHDLNSKGKSHRVIGSGHINFNYYISQLQIEKVLDFCIEVRPREKAYESMINLKPILHSES